MESKRCSRITSNPHVRPLSFPVVRFLLPPRPLPHGRSTDTLTGIGIEAKPIYDYLLLAFQPVPGQADGGSFYSLLNNRTIPAEESGTPSCASLLPFLTFAVVLFFFQSCFSLPFPLPFLFLIAFRFLSLFLCLSFSFPYPCLTSPFLSCGATVPMASTFP